MVNPARFLILAALMFAHAAQAQILRVAELNVDRIRALDRARTVVLLPGGILEQHGPYLPSFSDGYGNQWLTERLAEAIVKRPGWSVLIFPTIPLGTGGANEIGRKFSFPGTYAVRSTTLRSIFMDLGDELGQQGFQWVFIVHGHGAPNHNRALDDAGDYFRDTYGGHMVHLLGLLPVISAGRTPLAGADKEEEGFSVHAGASETAGLLFLQPALVSSAYRTARSQTAKTWADLVQLAQADGWPGFFGAPRLATAAAGAVGTDEMRIVATDFVTKILDGLDERTLLRVGEVTKGTPENVAIDRDALKREDESVARQQAWLAKRAARK